MMASNWQPNDLRQVSCDLCKRSETRNLFLRPDGMQAVECVNCGLAYLNPRPKPELVAKLYDRSYFIGNPADLNVGYATGYLDQKNRQAMISFAELKLRLLQRFWTAAGAKCLEVGCATAEFSYVLKQQGAHPVALDLSEFAVSEARNAYPELDVRVGDIGCLAERESFDALFAFELIEHVLSPSDFFESAKRLLKPGGFLILSTPNLDCAKAIGLENWLGFQVSLEHLYYFSAATLSRFSERQGFAMRSWFTGAGNGVWAPAAETTIKSLLRRTVAMAGLLRTVRRIRRRINSQPGESDYMNEGRRHNLLAVLQKHTAG
jgi:SAM-dependent methyltransferase